MYQWRGREKHVLEDSLSRHRLDTKTKRLRILLVLLVEDLELRGVVVERLVQVWHFIRIEERDDALCLEPPPEELQRRPRRDGG